MVEFFPVGAFWAGEIGFEALLWRQTYYSLVAAEPDYVESTERSGGAVSRNEAQEAFMNDSVSRMDEGRSDRQGAENMNKRKDAILKLRQVLIRRRDALRRALAGDLSSLKELREQSSGDVVDFALDSAQDELNSQLAEVESRELAQIENALERMRNGTYGICEVTGKPIPLARLQALPYATMCIEAQREAEKRGKYGRSASDWTRVTESDSDSDDDVVLNDLEMDVS